jgi:hypothetical protein
MPPVKSAQLMRIQLERYDTVMPLAVISESPICRLGLRCHHEPSLRVRFEQLKAPPAGRPKAHWRVRDMQYKRERDDSVRYDSDESTDNGLICFLYCLIWLKNGERFIPLDFYHSIGALKLLSPVKLKLFEECTETISSQFCKQIICGVNTCHVQLSPN